MSSGLVTVRNWTPTPADGHTDRRPPVIMQATGQLRIWTRPSVATPIGETVTVIDILNPTITETSDPPTIVRIELFQATITTRQPPNFTAVGWIGSATGNYPPGIHSGFAEINVNYDDPESST